MIQNQGRSDAAGLNRMIEQGLKTGGIVTIKDPTRGGGANTLNEWASKSRTLFIIFGKVAKQTTGAMRSRMARESQMARMNKLHEYKEVKE